ncbi:GTPase, G3E family [Devosia sp. YR412]|uniref:CobW family GTP-binding protein n=1 Tax=Devosia sp. YR412 TaxID=1881030 RepID=UPI0008ACA249|nr:GTP-binding protein [Devosia sp. YR412]SEP73851.1 GTPase, G3E family [Devosia sp. YR412]
MTALTTINLLTGFLGSGKTTLLQRLLDYPDLSGAAVLINEFGEVGLDHQLLDRIDANVVLMKSGCLCCTVRGEIADALLNLHSLRARGEVPWFDRVVIETTGLADPYPVLSTIRAHPVLRSHFSAGTVIATVDAVNGHGLLATRQEALQQVAAADVVILTKGDLVAPETVADLTAMLTAINPTASVRDAAGIDADMVLDAHAGRLRDLPVLPLAGHSHHAGESGTVQSFSIVTDQQLDWTVFGIWLTMLLHRHGDKVLRVKGILNIAGDDRPVAVHGVQRLVHPPVHMSGWPDADRRSRLVFIMQDLDPALVRHSFEVFHRLAGTQEDAAVAS